MTRILFVLLSLTWIAPLASAQNNEELRNLYEQDQAARQSNDIDWDVLAIEDAERRQEVLEIFALGNIRTARDYFNAAMIFQHGKSPEEIRLAHSFATLAVTLDSDLKQANWLQAASWDRILLRFNQPQWYGTQYIKTDNGGIRLYEVAQGVISDEERSAWGVPSLEEAQARTVKPGRE